VLRGREPIQHETDCREVDHGFGSLHCLFAIFTHPTIATQSRKAAFHDPGQAGDLERALPMLHNHELPTVLLQEATG